MKRPVLIYDGDCGFCRRWVRRWERALEGRVDALSSREAGPRFPSLPRAALSQALHLVEPDGRVSRGAEAVFRALSYAPGRGLALRLYERSPAFARASESVYAFLAARRPLLSRLSALFWGD